VSPWAWLLGAAAAEVAWSQSIKPTDGFTRVLPTLLCFVLGVAAVYPLTRAMQGIPVGTAYTVFTGIGITGMTTKPPLTGTGCWRKGASVDTGSTPG